MGVVAGMIHLIDCYGSEREEEVRQKQKQKQEVEEQEMKRKSHLLARTVLSEKMLASNLQTRLAKYHKKYCTHNVEE